MKTVWILFLFAASISAPAFAKSTEEKESQKIVEIIISTPLDKFKESNYSFYTAEVRRERTFLRENLVAQLEDESSSDYDETFRHFEITRILNNFNSNFPFYYRMSKLGLNVFDAHTLLVLLNSFDKVSDVPGGDNEVVRRFLYHALKSKSIMYRFQSALKSSPFGNFCAKMLTGLQR